MRTRNTGFTLIELLVVVSIIAIAFSAFIMLGFSFSNPQDALRAIGASKLGIIFFRRLSGLHALLHRHLAVCTGKIGARFGGIGLGWCRRHRG